MGLAVLLTNFEFDLEASRIGNLDYSSPTAFAERDLKLVVKENGVKFSGILSS